MDASYEPNRPCQVYFLPVHCPDYLQTTARRLVVRIRKRACGPIAQFNLVDYFNRLS